MEMRVRDARADFDCAIPGCAGAGKGVKDGVGDWRFPALTAAGRCDADTAKDLATPGSQAAPQKISIYLPTYPSTQNLPFSPPPIYLPTYPSTRFLIENYTGGVDVN